jgi:hypothetical protein
MGQALVFAIVGLSVFFILLFFVVESWKARLILGGIVLGIWLWFGLIGAMIAAAVFSIGILIGNQVPSVSKF